MVYKSNKNKIMDSNYAVNSFLLEGILWFKSIINFLLIINIIKCRMRGFGVFCSFSGKETPVGATGWFRLGKLSVMHYSCYFMSNSFSICQGRDAARWWSAPVWMWHPFSASRAKDCDRDIETLPQFASALQFTASAPDHSEREIRKLLGKKLKKRRWDKRGEEKRRKREENETLLFKVFSLPSSCTLLPSHQNEGLISEKHSTQHAHRHKDESTHTHIQRRDSHAGE